jgi:hypothetical protein
MKFDELNQDNWLMFAIRNYNNPNSVTFDDFKKDLNKIKCIKRLFRRYEMHGELKVHLILNHIIVMYNVFDDAATPLLFYKIDAKHWAILKAFMIVLNRLPDTLNTDVDQECLKHLNLL